MCVSESECYTMHHQNNNNASGDYTTATTTTATELEHSAAAAKVDGVLVQFLLQHPPPCRCSLFTSTTML